MRRREFIAGLGGAAAMPFATRAQQPEPTQIQLAVDLSIAWPDREATSLGVTQFEHSLSIKWLELLKEIVPTAKKVAIMRNLEIPSGSGQLGALQGVASSLGVELRPIDVLNAREIERVIAQRSHDGLIVTGGGGGVRRKLIIELAALHQLPTIYPYRYFVTDGGLMSYGPNMTEQARHAAAYVDRVLKGEKKQEFLEQAGTSRIVCADSARA